MQNNENHAAQYTMSCLFLSVIIKVRKGVGQILAQCQAQTVASLSYDHWPQGH